MILLLEFFHCRM